MCPRRLVFAVLVVASAGTAATTTIVTEKAAAGFRIHVVVRAIPTAVSRGGSTGSGTRRVECKSPFIENPF